MNRRRAAAASGVSASSETTGICGRAPANRERMTLLAARSAAVTGLPSAFACALRVLAPIRQDRGARLQGGRDEEIGDRGEIR